MKYKIAEQSDGTHKLYRRDNLTNRLFGKMPNGTPTNAELEFWFQLQAAEETINQIEAALCVDAAEYVPAIQNVFKLIDEYRKE